MSDLEPIDGVDLDDYLRARAKIEHAPHELTMVVESLALPDADAWRRIEEGWRQRMENDAQLGDVAGQFLADYARQARGEPRGDEEDKEDKDGREPRELDPTEPQPLLHQVPSFMQAQREAPAFDTPPLVPPPAPLAAAPPVARPPVAAASPPFAPETAPLDMAALKALLLANPTPFAGKTSPERLEQLRAAASEDEETRFQQVARGTDQADETAMFVPSASMRAQLQNQNQTLPFMRPPESTKFPDLSVDRYAAFAAELQARGASPEILARYEVTTPGALLALRAEHERRFAADPALRARFEERKANFLSFMQPLK